MEFRRPEPSGSRRRRVLTEETLSESGSTRGQPRSARRRTSDTKIALMEDPHRLTDLVPRRGVTLSLLFVIGLLITGALAAGFHWLPALETHSATGHIAALDLETEGSLAGWFSSLLMHLAAFAAVVVYFVRRLQTDDYGGRYRMWIWAALCWLAMGIDEAASLHEGFRDVMSQVTGYQIFGDGSIWWVAPYSLILGVLGLRLLLDMRGDWLSRVSLATAGALLVVSAAVQMDVDLALDGRQQVMAEETAEMTGFLLIWLTMCLHSRFLIAQSGRAPARKRKSRKKTSPPTSKTTAKKGSTARPKTAPTKATATKSTATSGPVRVDAAESKDSGERLSKAERRRLRKESRRQKRQGAGE